MKLLITLLLILTSLTSYCQDRHEVYIEKYARVALEEQYKFGIPASVTLAQAIKEGASRSEKSLVTRHHNHFGVKASSWQSSAWDGSTVKTTTHEYRNGKRIDNIRAKFKSYCSVWYAYRDRSETLRRVGAYKKIWDCEELECWADVLGDHWATSPTYSADLLRLIGKYDLERFDDPDLIFEYYPEWNQPEEPLVCDTLYLTDTLYVTDTLWRARPVNFAEMSSDNWKYPKTPVICGLLLLIGAFFYWRK